MPRDRQPGSLRAPALLTSLACLLLVRCGGGQGCDGPGPDDDTTADDDTSTDDDTSADDDTSTDDDTGDDDTTPVDSFELLTVCDPLAAFDPDEIDAPAFGSEGYSPPPGYVLDGVGASMTALLAGDGASALAALDGTDYELCRGEGETSEVALWRPSVAGDGRALAAWRRGPARPLIVGVPHAHLELVTLEQGLTAFDRLEARALVVTGTHRCANAAATPCDGTTTACAGEEGPFRESDMAHVEDSVFQVAHEALATAHPDDWVLSLHGMDLSGISVSDGTTLDSELGTPVADLTAALMEAFPGEWVTTCNSWPGAVVEERLCGTFNVQGRWFNASVDPCTESAGLSSGRFLHVEQSAPIREYPDLLIGALDDAVPSVR